MSWKKNPKTTPKTPQNLKELRICCSEWGFGMMNQHHNLLSGSISQVASLHGAGADPARGSLSARSALIMALKKSNMTKKIELFPRWLLAPSSSQQGKEMAGGQEMAGG